MKRAKEVEDVVKEKTPVNVAPGEDPTELRPMPDLIPTPGVGNFAHKEAK